MKKQLELMEGLQFGGWEKHSLVEPQPSLEMGCRETEESSEIPGQWRELVLTQRKELVLTLLLSELFAADNMVYQSEYRKEHMMLPL